MTEYSLPNIGPNTGLSIDEATTRLKACADSGLFQHAIAKQNGGHNNSFAELIQAHEALGEKTRDPGLILAINAHLWGAVFAVLRFGREQQKKEWIAPLLAGEIIGGHAITEPQAGSNVQMMECNYTESDDAFILNGTKRYITNTPIAGMMVVYARMINSSNISAFIIKPEDKGANFKHSPTVKGCASATMGDIVLENCSLDKSRLLGKIGAGNTMIQLALEFERAFIFAGIAGVMQWQLNETVQYAKNRDTGGQKLSAHQAISHKIADMKTRLDTTNLWISRCADLLDNGKRITIPSAQTKLYASETFLQNSLETIHIMGAAGLRNELTSLVEDAMAGQLMSGSSEIQKNIIAAMLGLPNK